MNLLVLMNGSHPSFEQAGYTFPRNLVQIDDRPILQHVMENIFPLRALGTKICVLINRDEDRRFHTSRVLALLDPQISVQVVDGQTSGALCTSLLAIEHIDIDQPLIVSNGDILIDCDITMAIRDFQQRDLDGGAIVFRDIHPRWSFIQVGSDGLAVQAAEKRPISHHATTGFYYYKRGEDFLKAAFNSLLKDAHVDGLFYICPIFNEMILDQKKIGVWSIERSSYHTLKTAEDVRAYEEHLVGSRR